MTSDHHNTNVKSVMQGASDAVGHRWAGGVRRPHQVLLQRGPGGGDCHSHDDCDD